MGNDTSPESGGPVEWEQLLLWVEKTLIWGGILGVLYIFRDFFAVVFLTFVFSYISINVTRKLSRRFGHRKSMVTLVFLLYLALLVFAGLRIVPVVYREARDMADRFPRPQQTAREVMEQTGSPPEVPYVDRLFETLIGVDRFRRWIRSDWYRYVARQVSAFVVQKVPNLIEYAGSLFKGVFTLTFHFLLALLFSFLIVLDFDTLAGKVSRLENSRISEIYAEVAPGIRSFFGVLGRAFEAQAIIAVVNTLLTGIGILFMQLPNAALLSAVVFFCSFIPVFGVIISSIPIALLALKTGGILLMVAAILFILVIHGIETYVLNPQIYGHHMELHPLMVLIVLLVGEHFFGIWGLILGVPVFRYVWNQLILEVEPQFTIS